MLSTKDRNWEIRRVMLERYRISRRMFARMNEPALHDLHQSFAPNIPYERFIFILNDAMQ